MINIDENIMRAELHFNAHGVRLTEKRKMLFTALLQSNKALSAYELVDFCKAQYNKNITTMSVYRILAFLETEKFAHKIHIANKFVACSHTYCGDEGSFPQFLICVKCGKVKEISVHPSVISGFETSVNEAGFQLTHTQLEINCLCDDCLEQAA